MQLRKLAKEYDTNQFAFVWDSKKSHREKLFPAYKERRRTGEKTPEEKELDTAAYKQFDLLYEKYLPAIGFVNNFKADGFEGDDLIASIVNTNLNLPFYIVSGDEDLYQLLDEDVSMIKAKGLYTLLDFQKEYGIDPALWSTVKAIAGCSTDEVPGVRGVGEVTAIKYLKDELTPNLKGYKSITSPEGRAIKARNMPLVTLPFKGCPDILIIEYSTLSFDGFMNMCIELDFQYFLKKEELSKWKQLLKLR